MKPKYSEAVCERQAQEVVTLPAHQHITEEQIDYMVTTIREFYGA